MENVDGLRKKVGIMVLAAGSSTRLGQSKQLLDIGGQPLLRKAANAAFASLGKNTVIVLGAYHEIHEKAIAQLPVHRVVNENWKNGMGSSIKAGLRFLSNLIADMEAVMVMVCDQPQVTNAQLDKVIHEYASTGKSIVASSYSSTLGVPALFHQSLFDSIANLNDQHGAKKIIESNPELVKAIEFPGGAIDIDTLEDYNNYLRLSD